MPLHLSQLPAAKRLGIERLWQTGIRGRLPRHYVKFFQEWQKGPEIPIHYRAKPGRFEKNEWGQVVRIQNPQIPVLYPEEFHQGLWGGEGVVKGFQEPPPTKHQPNYKPPQETYYWPKLYLVTIFGLEKNIDPFAKRSVLNYDQITAHTPFRRLALPNLTSLNQGSRPA